MATRWFICLALFLAGADWFTKHLARTSLDEGVRHKIIPGFFRITLNYNEGIAWGMFPEYKEYLTVFAMVMVIVILIFMRRLERDEVWLKISLALMMAGAIGNMFDRLIMRKVTDFLDVRLFLPGSAWDYDWPIFNLADSYIVIGATILFFIVVLSAGDTLASKKEPMPVAIAAGLGGMNDRDGWVEGPEASGSVPVEEALVELKTDAEDEMLVPYEEADKVREETLTGALGSERPHKDEPVSPEDEDKLDELSRRPEPEP